MIIFWNRNHVTGSRYEGYIPSYLYPYTCILHIWIRIHVSFISVPGYMYPSYLYPDLQIHVSFIFGSVYMYPSYLYPDPCILHILIRIHVSFISDPDLYILHIWIRIHVSFISGSGSIYPSYLDPDLYILHICIQIHVSFTSRSGSKWFTMDPGSGSLYIPCFTSIINQGYIFFILPTPPVALGGAKIWVIGRLGKKYDDLLRKKHKCKE